MNIHVFDNMDQHSFDKPKTNIMIPFQMAQSRSTLQWIIILHYRSTLYRDATVPFVHAVSYIVRMFQQIPTRCGHIEAGSVNPVSHLALFPAREVGHPVSDAIQPLP